jgi:hypothetical protein
MGLHKGVIQLKARFGGIPVHCYIPLQRSSIRIPVIKQCSIHTQNPIGEKLGNGCSLGCNIFLMIKSVIAGLYPFDDLFINQLPDVICVVTQSN